MKIAYALPAALTLALAATAAQATIKVYTATLSGATEVPSVVTTGHGTTRVTFDSALSTLRVEVSFADLVGNVTASHIHCCTAPGSNVGVATALPSFVGFPLGVTSGTYDYTYDMTQASSFNPAFVTAHGGALGSALSDLITGLDSGVGYLNVHTNFRPGGEIRGLLAPVPEPSTYALMALGLGAVGFAARRRRA